MNERRIATHTPGPWTLQELEGDEVYMIGLPQEVGFS